MDKTRRDYLSEYERAAMRVVLQPLLEEELEEFDAMNQVPHEYSEEFTRKVNSIFQRDKAKNGFKKSLVYAKKILVCASVALALLLAACAAVKPVREKIAGAFVSWYEKYAEISYAAEDTGTQLLRPAEIPEGYAETYRLEGENGVDLYLVYTNDEEKRIVFERYLNDEGQRVLVDDEHTNMVEMNFRGMRAIYLEPQRDEVAYSILWQEENIIYCIDADESLERMLEFAENVK